MELMITVSEMSLPNMDKLLKVSFPLLHLPWLYLFLTSYASICPARIILDRESGRSRGFGFVTYTSSEEASAAITAMDGKVSSYFE